MKQTLKQFAVLMLIIGVIIIADQVLGYVTGKTLFDYFNP